MYDIDIGWHFKQSQQLEQQMESPSLLDLQYLISRLRENPVLNSHDADLLDRTHSMPTSTQIANTTNQILMFIMESPIQFFWQSFSTIVSSSPSDETLILILSIVNKRVRNQWHSFGQSIHQDLKVFIVESIKMALDSRKERVLLTLNQILVSMLLYEWNSLFKDFVSNLENQGVNIQTNKLLNNLTILRLLLEEGFTLKQQLISPIQYEQFQMSLENDMRIILRLLCTCLMKEGEDREVTILKCLQTLKYTIDYIPTFEIFNCNLIELLVGLIGVHSYQRPLIICFEEIFRFKETEALQASHAKIANKLLLILESYLSSFEGTKINQHRAGKQCESTEDSFQSRMTKKSNRYQFKRNRELLNLLYQFLLRYVPFMDKTRQQSDVELQYDSAIKIYYSTDMYQTFKSIYWRLLDFLLITITNLDPFHTIQSEQYVEDCRKSIICLKLMILMLHKLKLNYKQQLKDVIKQALINFTPLRPQFFPCYLHYGLLQNRLQIATEEPFFSTNFQDEYKELIKTLISYKDTLKIYFEIITNSLLSTELYKVTEVDRSRKHMQIMSNKDFDSYSLRKTVNRFNRLSWSAVYSYQYNSEAFDLSIDKIVLHMSKQANYSPYDGLKICYSINSKFLTQVYYPTASTLHLHHLRSIPAIQNQIILQYAFLLNSNIFLVQNYEPSIEWQQIKKIVQKFMENEQTDVEKESLIQTYPAVINFIFKKSERNNSADSVKKSKEIISILIFNTVNSLQHFSKLNCTRDHVDLTRTVFLFKKFNKITQHLLHLEKNGKLNTNNMVFITWIRNIIIKAIKQFQYKHKILNNFLDTLQRQDEGLEYIFTFRRYYLSVVQSWISLNMISMNQPKSKERLEQMAVTERQMRMDFIKQREFKNIYFFQVALKFYGWMIKSEGRNYEERINESIEQILESLNGWDRDQQVIRQKYKFWVQVVEIFCMGLNQKNLNNLMQILIEFDQARTQSSTTELILDIFDKLMQVLNRQFLKNKKPFKFNEFIFMFKKTFELLFGASANKDFIFQRISHLLYSQLMFVSYLPPECFSSIGSSMKKDTVDIFYLLLQDHIERTLNISFNQENYALLQKIFKESNQNRWRINLKEYVVYLKRLFRARGQQSS